jgi:hypothetical protein
MFRKTALVRQIDAAIYEGKSLEDIDAAVLAPARVSDDMRSALWLYAVGALERAEVHGARAASPATHLPRI